MDSTSQAITKRNIKPIRVLELINEYIYRIDLDADYQREKIWSRKNQEDLLDSIIRNIDIPKIYLAEVNSNKQFDYECIDGKQRMITLLNFYKPDKGEVKPLKIEVAGEKYTYKELQSSFPEVAKKIDEYEFTFVIYKETEDEEFIKLIFRRLQLGIRLNSGELLKTYSGTIRDFIYKDIGNNGPFFRYTKLSEKRFSRPFTLAQICINSFKRKETGNFVRARLDDIQDFFQDNFDLDKNDKNLLRLKKVLKIMDDNFGKKAEIISSRAIAVTAYMFIEYLYLDNKESLILEFINFYIKLLNEIKKNMKLISEYKEAENSVIMEEFQKYVLQASVEQYSLNRRHQFLKDAFNYYKSEKTKEKIIGSK